MAVAAGRTQRHPVPRTRWSTYVFIEEEVVATTRPLTLRHGQRRLDWTTSPPTSHPLAAAVSTETHLRLLCFLTSGREDLWPMPTAGDGVLVAMAAAKGAAAGRIQITITVFL